VGDLLAITLRVGGLSCLIRSWSPRVWHRHERTWLAQPLGGADAPQKPASIAKATDGEASTCLARRRDQISKKYRLHGQLRPGPARLDNRRAERGGDEISAAMAIDGAVTTMALSVGGSWFCRPGSWSSTITPKPHAGDGRAIGTVHEHGRARPVHAEVKRRERHAHEQGRPDAGYPESAHRLWPRRPSGMTVDEGRSTRYVASGRKVYPEALLKPRGADHTSTPTAQPRPTNHPCALRLRP